MKKIKYTHPSSCGYNPNVIYNLDEILKDMDINKIKVMFEPINFKWKDLDKKKAKKEIKPVEEIIEVVEETKVPDIDRAD